MQNFESFQCCEGLFPGPQHQDPCLVVPDLPVSSPDLCGRPHFVTQHAQSMTVQVQFVTVHIFNRQFTETVQGESEWSRLDWSK